jgi:hypothetical protein
MPTKKQDAMSVKDEEIKEKEKIKRNKKGV